ncbi:MAG TPA: hypothetical protein VKB46_22780 [Pyrinomonadaceae bacterium]|nr:hypothetical protein [Pyrinomonadaceae bacterium]
MQRVKVLLAIVMVFSLQSVGFAQTFGYSGTDNDQDVTNRPQQFYKINIITGETKYLGDYLVDRNNDNAYNESIASGTGERVQREYEGMASIDGVLYAVPEFANLQGVGQVCNTGQDPVSGLSVDLRIFRYNGPQQIVPTSANRLPQPVELLTPGGASLENSGSIIGPQIGETCIQFGTESALGYNAQDGYLYSIASDDLIPLPNIRSRLYKIDPTTGLAVASADITNPCFNPTTGAPTGVCTSLQPGDPNPYFDGMTILPNGTAYASEVRFDVDPQAADADTCDAGGLYRIYLNTGSTGAASGNACPNNLAVGMGTACIIKHLLPATLTRDTGLANQANGTLYMLNERGIIYRFTGVQACNVVTLNTLHTTGATEGAGGGAAGQRIEGCRGHVNTTTEFELGADLSIGGCSDFEAFDVPLKVLSTPSVQAAP